MLSIFEGPLDLLLYLIRKHNLDILNIPVADITRQYMEYVDLMKEFRLELAAEYLEMAALLAEIKSRLLLPKSPEAVAEELDPRAELVRRLQEYERFKVAAQQLEHLPRLGRDYFEVAVEVPSIDKIAVYAPVSMDELFSAFQSVLSRLDLKEVHKIQRETLSVREKMSLFLSCLEIENFKEFSTFFNRAEGRPGFVVTFLAILELAKSALIELVQNQNFGPIYLRLAAG